MKNLTSIAEHSDYLSASTYSDLEKWQLHRLRVKFGKQPLEIWQFIPCKLVDGVWVVLEEPEIYKITAKTGTSKAELEWIEAKEKCLFQGLEYQKRIKSMTNNGITYSGYRIYNKTADLFQMWDIIFDEDGNPRYKSTIEDVAKYNPELTVTSIKQLAF